MLATKSSNGALKRLHEGDLSWIINVELHGLLNEDRVAKALRTFNNRARTSSVLDERTVSLVLLLGAIFRSGSGVREKRQA